MYSSKEKFIEALGVSTMPELFGARFEETMREYEEKGVFFLEESYIDSLQDKYNLFPEKYDFVKKSAKRVRENDLLARYSLLLEHMLRDKNDNELIPTAIRARKAHVTHLTSSAFLRRTQTHL